ncbi:hypothetical protein Hanom_Chr05g00473431 [Helianthus anomalus]
MRRVVGEWCYGGESDRRRGVRWRYKGCRVMRNDGGRRSEGLSIRDVAGTRILVEVVTSELTLSFCSVYFLYFLVLSKTTGVRRSSSFRRLNGGRRRFTTGTTSNVVSVYIGGLEESNAVA